MFWIWVVACGQTDPQPLRSVPSPPAVELGGDGQLEPVVVITDLKSLFTSEAVRPPGALSGLEPGLPRAASMRILDAAHAPGTPMTSLERGGRWIVQARLADSERVGVTLIFDASGELLDQVDLSLSEPEAMLVLAERWGPPQSAPPLKDGRRFNRWPGPSWEAELHALDGRNGVLKFLPSSTPTATSEPSGHAP